MVSFVDNAVERNPGVLQGADMIPDIHEQSGILRQLFEPERDLGFELGTRAHVDLGFVQRNRHRVPDRGITCNH